MKKILSVLLLVLVISVSAQSEASAELIDEFGEECVESVLARRDSFFQALGKVPGSHGVIVLYGKRDLEGRNRKLEQYYARFDVLAQQHLGTTIRGFRGGNSEELRVQFWLVPPGAADPLPDPQYKPQSYQTTTLFDRSWADFHRWDGPLDIYSDSFYDLGCWFSPNRGLLAKLLKQDLALQVRLVAYGGKDTKAVRTRKVLTFAVNDLVKNYKIPRKRITASYGGRRQEPQIEFFLVPTGGALPNSSPDPNRGVQ